MSIDYFGHTTRDAKAATALIEQARAAHPEWFDSVLLLTDARPFRHAFEAETSRDFGIAAKSGFMLSVNDKERFSDCLDDALDYLYALFGNGTLVMTHGFDSVRPPGPARAP
ncbi:MAG: hypothetical protein JOZ72_04885 [Alphaproteobacteria bacterium]|nr:hypothetical protein [Alphaproteobacteria bacterium]